MPQGAPDGVVIEVPEAFHFLLQPSRYKGAYGGRGAAKSQSVARVLLGTARQKYKRILCGREYQNSIEESVHFLLKSQIAKMGMSHEWRITENHIIHRTTGSNFSFKGIKNNINNVKSLEDFDIFWGEEAQTFSHASFEILIPTFRKPGSELWFSWNTDDATTPVHKRLVVNPPPNSLVRMINYDQNPFFTDELEAERAYMERNDPDAYANIWLGQVKRRSDSQILKNKWVVEEFDETLFTAAGIDPLYGADWGFADDPSTLARCFLVGATLYITHEAYGKRVDTCDLPALFAPVPGSFTHPIRGDSSRPETISALNRGQEATATRPAVPPMNVQSVTKWNGSVEDGIAFLRGLERIVIHPRCPRTAEEARLWSYKVHRQTNDILPEVLDGNDHMWDAIRYALQPIIQTSTRNDGMIAYLVGQVAEQQAERERQQMKGQ